MARKKPANGKADRSDPKSNKSLAIRMVLKKLPKNAKAAEVVAAVKKTYGHDVSPNMVYMIKTKTTMFAGQRARKLKVSDNSPMTSAALWIDAIKMAKDLLEATGSVANATALLEALDNSEEVA